jgi:hypothetical protein
VPDLFFQRCILEPDDLRLFLEFFLGIDAERIRIL